MHPSCYRIADVNGHKLYVCCITFFDRILNESGLGEMHDHLQVRKIVKIDVDHCSESYNIHAYLELIEAPCSTFILLGTVVQAYMLRFIICVPYSLQNVKAIKCLSIVSRWPFIDTYLKVCYTPLMSWLAVCKRNSNCSALM